MFGIERANAGIEKCKTETQSFGHPEPIASSFFASTFKCAFDMELAWRCSPIHCFQFNRLKIPDHFQNRRKPKKSLFVKKFDDFQQHNRCKQPENWRAYSFCLSINRLILHMICQWAK